jgi:phosphoglycerol transferase MdoB-like AlkP superfamily enzyme
MRFVFLLGQLTLVIVDIAGWRPLWKYFWDLTAIVGAPFLYFTAETRRQRMGLKLEVRQAVIIMIPATAVFGSTSQ